MKRIIFALIAFSLAFAPCLIVTDASARGSTSVKGYTKKERHICCPTQAHCPQQYQDGQLFD